MAVAQRMPAVLLLFTVYVLQSKQTLMKSPVTSLLVQVVLMETGSILLLQQDLLRSKLTRAVLGVEIRAVAVPFMTALPALQPVQVTKVKAPVNPTILLLVTLVSMILQVLPVVEAVRLRQTCCTLPDEVLIIPLHTVVGTHLLTFKLIYTSEGKVTARQKVEGWQTLVQKFMVQLVTRPVVGVREVMVKTSVAGLRTLIARGDERERTQQQTFVSDMAKALVTALQQLTLGGALNQKLMATLLLAGIMLPTTKVICCPSCEFPQMNEVPLMVMLLQTMLFMKEVKRKTSLILEGISTPGMQSNVKVAGDWLTVQTALIVTMFITLYAQVQEYNDEPSSTLLDESVCEQNVCMPNAYDFSGLLGLMMSPIVRVRSWAEMPLVELMYIQSTLLMGSLMLHDVCALGSTADSMHLLLPEKLFKFISKGKSNSMSALVPNGCEVFTVNVQSDLLPILLLATATVRSPVVKMAGDGRTVVKMSIYYSELRKNLKVSLRGDAEAGTCILKLVSIN